MARPRKPDQDKRTRWDALYVTPSERLEITKAAKQADLSVSQYRLAAHRRRGPSADRMGTILALIQAERELAAIARQLHAVPTDALVLHSDLLAIERSFRRAALPWAYRLEGDAC